MGKGGRVLGVDIQPLGVGLPANGRFIEADLHEVTAEELATLSETINYELLARLSTAIPRFVVGDVADTPPR